MSDQTTLTIKFSGICTHFRGTVPGLAHRAVLPNTHMLRMGEVRRGKRAVEQYVILPHIPFVKSPGTHIDVPHLIDRGRLIAGVRLQIANGIGALTYDPAFEQVKSLTEYLPYYRPSPEVVYGGRATCYFDLSAGYVSIYERGEAVHTKVTVPTAGKPVLRITPLESDPTAETAPMWDIVLEGDELIVGNISRGCRHRHTFDFLLNYLTAEGGIPHNIGDIPMELEAEDDPLDLIATIGRFLTPAGIDRDAIREMLTTDEYDTSPACSDSRYP
jgi:hypothetical protein